MHRPDLATTSRRRRWRATGVGLLAGLSALLGSGTAHAAGDAGPAAEPPRASTEALQSAQLRLDRGFGAADEPVTAWYVGDGALVVETLDGAAGQRFVDRAGVGGVATVTVVAQRPRPLAALGSGDPITDDGTRCTTGFGVRDARSSYVVTAGHCLDRRPGRWVTAEDVPIGPVDRVAYPTDDYGLIRVTEPTLELVGRVRGGGVVAGATPAAVGDEVCRTGATTGRRCGTVTALDATVNFGDGNIVDGLTRTSACAEPGDSGGPYLAGDQAQGILSGGSGDCRRGGHTFFQPITEILERTGSSLVTG